MPRTKNTTTTTTKAPSTKRTGKTAKATKTTTPTMSTAMDAGPTWKSTIVITDDERRHMIAEAAYLRAEQRGFADGDPQADWYAAEQEVDARIAGGQVEGQRRNAQA